MGVLSEVVAAFAHEAEAVVAATPHRDRPWRWVDARGLDPLGLGRLDAVLRGGADDETFAERCETLAALSDEEGPWVMRVPPELTDRLAALRDDAVPAAARAGVESEELAGWGEEDAAALLASLAGLARHARESGRELLLWMAL